MKEPREDSCGCGQWLITGLGGVVNMLERFTDEGLTLSPHYLETLERIGERAIAVWNKQVGFRNKLDGK